MRRSMIALAFAAFTSLSVGGCSRGCRPAPPEPRASRPIVDMVEPVGFSNAKLERARDRDARQRETDTYGEGYPAGRYRTVLWNREVVYLSILHDGAFELRSGDGSRSGRLVAKGDRWVLRHIDGQRPLGAKCFDEGSTLKRLGSDVLEGSCMWKSLRELLDDIEDQKAGRRVTPRWPEDYTARFERVR